MLMFPVWLLQGLVLGALALCALGAVSLILFLICDSRENRIW